LRSILLHSLGLGLEEEERRKESVGPTPRIGESRSKKEEDSAFTEGSKTSYYVRDRVKLLIGGSRSKQKDRSRDRLEGIDQGRFKGTDRKAIDDRRPTHQGVD
jgi:hypothetical protein